MSTSDRQIETNTYNTFGFLSPKDFLRLSDLIYSQCGIRMPEAKKAMLEKNWSSRTPRDLLRLAQVEGSSSKPQGSSK